MSTPKILIAAGVAALLGTLTCVQTSAFRRMDLSAVLNKTLCPIKVEFNEDENRIPRRIKMMKCGSEPRNWCQQNNLPAHDCCEHQHPKHHLECVEMRDTVLVYNKIRGHPEKLEVAVGCSCMLERPTAATKLTGP